MKHLVLMLALAGFGSSCELEPSEPNVIEEKVSLSELSFRLNRAQLGPLAEQSDRLDVSIYLQKSEVRGDLEQNLQFTLTDEGKYEIKDITIGPKFFVLELLDKDGKLLANAEFTYTVIPGAQTVDSVRLVPVEPTMVDVRFSVKVKLKDFPKSLPTSLPGNIDGTLASYNCYACHNSGFAQGGLDLQSFPFQSSRLDSFADIVKEVNRRVGSESNPMPPSGDGLNDEEITDLQTWATSLESDPKLDLTYIPSGQDSIKLVERGGSFVLPEDSMWRFESGTTLAGSLLVKTRDDVILLDKEVSWLVDLSGKWDIKEVITYQAPSVTIPITID